MRSAFFGFYCSYVPLRCEGAKKQMLTSLVKMLHNNLGAKKIYFIQLSK